MNAEVREYLKREVDARQRDRIGINGEGIREGYALQLAKNRSWHREYQTRLLTDAGFERHGERDKRCTECGRITNKYVAKKKSHHPACPRLEEN